MAMFGNLPLIFPDESLPKKERLRVIDVTMSEGEFESLAAMAAREKRSIPQHIRYIIRCGIHDLFARRPACSPPARG